jgi:hypothetical protein
MTGRDGRDRRDSSTGSATIWLLAASFLKNWNYLLVRNSTDVAQVYE